MSTQTTAGRELLERERELDVLGAALSRARDGAGGVVLIEGPVGVGKSRLLTSARSSARDAGMRVVEARGAVLERQFAFGVARQLFEQVAFAARAPRPSSCCGSRGTRGTAGEDAGPPRRRERARRLSARCTGCTGSRSTSPTGVPWCWRWMTRTGLTPPPSVSSATSPAASKGCRSRSSWLAVHRTRKARASGASSQTTQPPRS